jgi:uncharacterized membrane protein
MGDPVVIVGIPLPSDHPIVLALIGVHIVGGIVCVVAGAIAMLSPKGQGRHSFAGSVYYWSLLLVFASAAVLSVLFWPQDNHLFVLGAVAFAAASLGRWVQRAHQSDRPGVHIVSMGTSYIALLTAFYVDNGPHLPLWRDLPHAVYWLLPAGIGLPIIALALLRHPLRLDRNHSNSD